MITIQVWSDLLCPFAYVGLLRLRRARTRLGRDDEVLLEAVHAANAQNLVAGEHLDLALRRAFWTHSRSISHRQVILDVAGDVPSLDVSALAAALDGGEFRSAVMADFDVARSDAIPASPTFRFPDGTAVTNPGIEVHWDGPLASGFPVVDSHDAGVYEKLLTR